MSKVKKLYTRLEILLRNWLAGSKTVVSISRDATVPALSSIHVITCKCAVSVSGPRRGRNERCVMDFRDRVNGLSSCSL